MKLGWLATLLALVAPAAISCAPRSDVRSVGRAEECTPAAIDDLWANPRAYARRRVCVSGYLGRMVPYGEDSPKLYSTSEEAETTRSERYVTIGVPMTITSQEELSRHSVRPLRVQGVFEFDDRCWPQAGQTQADYTCFPSRPMRISNARVSFPGR